jgi:outer membrane biosynthesis protein TonB
MDDADDERGSRRVLTVAVLGSVFAHLLGFLIFGLTTNGFARLLPIPHPTKQPDAIVTLSHAFTISKRSHPQPEPQPQQARPQPQRPAKPAQQRVAAVPQPQPMPVPLPKPEQPAAPKTRVLHELDKQQAAATPEPPRTVKATAPPQPLQSEAPQGPPKQAAQAQRSAQTSVTHSSQLSQAQLAQMNEHFNTTLAQLRKESDPLAVHSEPPSAAKRYRMQMIGIEGDLKNGQGYYMPIKSWRDGGYNYYYVRYEFSWSDGTVETGGVPWPIRFKPNEDPFANPGNEKLAHIELAPPLPGWKLPPGEKPGKALEAVFGDALKAAGQ